MAEALGWIAELLFAVLLGGLMLTAIAFVLHRVVWLTRDIARQARNWGNQEPPSADSDDWKLPGRR